jgi:RNA polymerase sigma-70 factor (ECF subfamily)
MQHTSCDTGSGTSRYLADACAHRSAMVAAADRVLRDEAAAEDVVQDVLFDLWRRPESFDADRGSLRPYLLMLTRSRALDRWRARAARAAATDRATQAAATDPSTASSAADAAIDRDSSQRLVRALGALPEQQRQAVLLTYGRGLTAQEVATVSGIPLGTAKSRLRLGLKRAHDALAAAS